MQVLLRRACVAVMALTLAGCATWAPPAGESALVVPANWASSASAADSRIADAPALTNDWWRDFGDAELDALVDAALVAAPDVRIARARLRQARAARDLAGANVWPTLSIGVSARRSAGTTPTSYAAALDAAWEPPIFGGTTDASDAAVADAAASEMSLAATQLSLAAEVVLDYIDWRGGLQRLAIARDSVARQTDTLRIVDWRKQAGLASALDLAQAQTSLEQARAALPALESAAQAALNRLAVLTARAPGQWQASLLATRDLPALPEDFAVALPADVLRQRPDVRAAELTLRAEIARTAERAADRMPSLSLSGTLGRQALSAGDLIDGTLTRSVVASLAATLFDGGRLRARFDAQDAVREQALIAYENTLVTALTDVDSALMALRAGREALAARQHAAQAADEAARLARALYESGLADFARVLETERTRLSAQDTRVSAQADALAARVRLAKALGGGWQSSTPRTEGTS